MSRNENSGNEIGFAGIARLFDEADYQINYQKDPKEPFNYKLESVLEGSLSVNKVILIGYLEKAPQFRETTNKSQLCTFSLITSSDTIDYRGDAIQKFEWHRVSIVDDQLIRLARELLEQGSRVYVEGQLRTYKDTDRLGITHYSTQIQVEQFKGTFLLIKTDHDAQRLGKVKSRDYSEEQYRFDSEDFRQNNNVSQSEFNEMLNWIRESGRTVSESSLAWALEVRNTLSDSFLSEEDTNGKHFIDYDDPYYERCPRNTIGQNEFELDDQDGDYFTDDFYSDGDDYLYDTEE